VTLNGDTTTLIGGNEKTWLDGPAQSARLVEPRALACDAANNLLIRKSFLFCSYSFI
jgi:hypothetical protein